MACEDSRIFVGELEESLNDRRAAIQEVLHNSIKDTICIYIYCIYVYICIYIYTQIYIYFVCRQSSGLTICRHFIDFASPRNRSLGRSAAVLFPGIWSLEQCNLDFIQIMTQGPKGPPGHLRLRQHVHLDTLKHKADALVWWPCTNHQLIFLARPQGILKLSPLNRIK